MLYNHSIILSKFVVRPVICLCLEICTVLVFPILFIFERCFFGLTDMEVIYKFLFSGQILHQLWYSPTDDVSVSEHQLLNEFTSTILWILKLLQLFEIDYVSFAYRARYGVQLEKGVFEKRTADFLWMMIFGAFSLLVSYSFFYPFRSALANTKRQLLSLYTIVYFLNQVVSAIPLFEFAFLGIPMVSMLLYVWSREYPNSQINMYGLVQLRVCNFTVLLSALSIFFFFVEKCIVHLHAAQMMQ